MIKMLKRIFGIGRRVEQTGSGKLRNYLSWGHE